MYGNNVAIMSPNDEKNSEQNFLETEHINAM